MKKLMVLAIAIVSMFGILGCGTKTEDTVETGVQSTEVTVPSGLQSTEATTIP